jgi:hypothetical protein
MRDAAGVSVSGGVVEGEAGVRLHVRVPCRVRDWSVQPRAEIRFAD